MVNIIFDYNRTLFDPDHNRLYDGVYEIFEKLSQDFSLFLFSYNEFGRDQFIENMSMKKFFKNIALVEEKDSRGMLSLTDGFLADVCFVVGDSLRGEIAIGNELGYETVWLQKGKFASEVPRNKQEIPKYTIQELEELLRIVEPYTKK